MKRTLAFFLAVIIICTAVILPSSNVAALEEVDITKEKTVLEAIGVINQSDGEGAFDAPVTRAKFATFVASMLKADSTTEKLYFTDVPSDYWAASAINSMRELGIVDKAADNRFNPEAYITYEQAYKMLIVAMGYKEYALSLGGAMSGYVKVANRLGMDLGKGYTENLGMGDAIRLLYLALVTEASLTYGVVEGDVISKVGDDNLLGVYHKTYIKEGVLRGASGQSMDNTDVDDEHIVIDGAYYEYNGSWKLWNLLGEKVEFVYTEQEKDGKVIYIESDEKNVTTVSSVDIESYADNVLSFYIKENKLKSQTIQKGAEVIYNGRPLNKSLTAVMNELISGEAKGEIRLIAGTDKKAHTVIITSYKMIVASQYDEKNKVLYNSFDKDKHIDLSKCNEFVVRSETAVRTTINTAFPAAFGVALSDDGERVELYSCDRTETAVISSIKQDGEIKLVLGDKTVTVDKSMYPYISDYLKAGKEVKLYYDVFGDVVYAQSASVADLKAGYICASGVLDEAFDKIVALVILTEDGTLEKYELDDSVKIDGESYSKKSYDQIIEAFPGGTMENGGNVPKQAIRYAVGTEGKISRIDTWHKGEKEEELLSLRRHLDGSRQCVYSVVAKTMSGDAYDDDTKFFILPLNADGDMRPNEYSTSVSTLVDSRLYYAESYYFSDSYVADIIVACTEPKKEVETLYMFDEVCKSLNEDEEVCDEVYCWTGGAQVSFTVAKECTFPLSELNRGDLVLVSTNQSGSEVMEIIRVFDVKSGKFVHTYEQQYLYNSNWFDRNDDYSWFQKNRIVKTYAGAVKNNMLCNSYDMSDLAKKDYYFTTNISSISITVFDPNQRTEQIFKGMQSDISTYESVGEMCDTIILSRRYGAINSIFIIKSER